METNHQNTMSGRPNSSQPVKSISKQTQRGLHLLQILPKEQKERKLEKVRLAPSKNPMGPNRKFPREGEIPGINGGRRLT